jgi:hypothetical protein
MPGLGATSARFDEAWLKSCRRGCPQRPMSHTLIEWWRSFQTICAYRQKSLPDETLAETGERVITCTPSKRHKLV